MCFHNNHRKQLHLPTGQIFLYTLGAFGLPYSATGKQFVHFFLNKCLTGDKARFKRRYLRAVPLDAYPPSVQSGLKRKCWFKSADSTGTSNFTASPLALLSFTSRDSNHRHPLCFFPTLTHWHLCKARFLVQLHNCPYTNLWWNETP